MVKERDGEKKQGEEEGEIERKRETRQRYTETDRSTERPWRAREATKEQFYFPFESPLLPSHHARHTEGKKKLKLPSTGFSKANNGDSVVPNRTSTAGLHTAVS